MRDLHQKDLRIHFLIAICFLTSGLLSLTVEPVFAETHGQERRPATVADSIQMTVPGDPVYFNQGPAPHLVQFSPDGKNFVIVLRKGNLEKNTNDFSLLLWHTKDVFSALAPEVLLTMSSSSNLDAITDVKWLDDNETIAFLGERPRESHQLFTYNIDTHLLKKITNHPTNLISYSISPQGDMIAYLAESPGDSIWTEKTRREGIIVSDQWLWDLVAGKTTGLGYYCQAFFYNRSTGVRQLKTMGRIPLWPPYMEAYSALPSISPDGKYAVVSAEVAEIPQSWKEYSYKWLSVVAGRKPPPWGINPTGVERYELVNTSTGESRVLLNAPLYGSKVLWASDSRSIIISNTFLPLDGTQGDERMKRQSQIYSLEINIQNGDLTIINKFNLNSPILSARWDRNANQLILKPSTAIEGLSELRFRKNGGRWEEAAGVQPRDMQPEIVLEEDINIPPTLFAVNPQNHEKALLLDLNPSFSRLKFGQVEEVQFKDSTGNVRKAGLYYPVDYVPGTKYPLVIQTHGWFPGSHRFWIDGFSTTANAAQALASKGILILQMDEFNPVTSETSGDGPQATMAYEDAIKYLDERGLINKSHIGIIGFSYTCYTVKYALTHSRLHFDAASVTDGYDGGYFNYLLNAGNSYAVALNQESLNGGMPFGAGLRAWFVNSPGFNIDKVQTPLLITALRPESVMIEWEWFAALRRLGKPVEMLIIQDGSHGLEKPSDRLASQGRNVDWFCFWLQGQEDPDPAKAEQYVRWHQLRDLPEMH